MRSVFIGGHPRSGTTLLGAMIGAHSDCICTPESQFKTRVLRDASVKNKGLTDPGTTLRLMNKDWRFRIWGLRIGSVPYDEISSYRDFLEFIVKAYGLKAGRPNPLVWVDHTPSNIKNAPVLLEIFPDAKFIHIVRDGRAVASSVMPLDWGPNTIDKAAYSWVKRLSQNLSVESMLGPMRIMRIKFEDLVQHPADAMKQVCRFLAVDYQPQMVEGAGFNVPRYTANQHSLVGKKPDPAEIDTWGTNLTARQVEIFEGIAGDMLLSLGYSLKYGGYTRKMTMVEKMISEIVEAYRGLIANRTRHRRRIAEGIASIKKEPYNRRD